MLALGPLFMFYWRVQVRACLLTQKIFKILCAKKCGLCCLCSFLTEHQNTAWHIITLPLICTCTHWHTNAGGVHRQQSRVEAPGRVGLEPNLLSPYYQLLSILPGTLMQAVHIASSRELQHLDSLDFSPPPVSLNLYIHICILAGSVHRQQP